MDSHPSTAPARRDSKFAGKRVHFIGIGGSGMSGLARMLLDGGAVVSGSEPKPSAVTFELAKRGARISRDQLGELLSREVDLVVRTAAVKDDNAELAAARALGLAHVKYAQLLGQVMQERHGVAIAGTHGKSTTTAMTAYALVQCGADPSFVVGGTVPQLGGGSRSGAGNAFVAEACEFDRSYHNLHPTVAVITNIEADHLDCYKDLDDIVDSFRTFANLLPPTGTIVALGGDANVARALSGVWCNVEYAGLVDGAFSNDGAPFTWTTVVTGIVAGCHTGDVYHKGRKVASLKLAVAGRHNLINATMAVAACHTCGVAPADAAAALATFTGVDRRMTEVGTYNGATVVDDYGHHPTEIRATLSALRERYRPARLFCVFQPHQHSRTRLLLDEFATAFTAADETLVPEIYAVRDSEAERRSVSSTMLVEKVCAAGSNAVHLPTFAAIVDRLKRTLQGGDLVVTMGAGNVWEIGRDVVG